MQKMISFRNYKGFKDVTDIKSHYKFGKKIGEGSFGCVFKCVNRQTDIQVAIKVIKKQKIQEHEIYLELLQNELLVLEKTDHPHITRVFEILEDKRNFYVVMEFLEGGNLLDKII
jgi:serine/threonine protein kinase